MDVTDQAPPLVGCTFMCASTAWDGVSFFYNGYSLVVSLLTSVRAGPLPWVYVSDIFPTRTRHYGLATASASQWLFSASVPLSVTSLAHRGCFSFLFASLTTNRLCRRQSDSQLDHQSRVQNLPHVRYHQHRCHGYILSVRFFPPPSCFPHVP